MLLSLNAILLLGILLHMNKTEAQAEECAEMNGDVNADGSLDLIDAIYFLEQKDRVGQYVRAVRNAQ